MNAHAWHGSQWISHKIDFRHPGILKKWKSWEKYLAFTISTCGKTCSSIGEFQYWISIFNMPCESLRLFVQNWKYLKVNLLFVMKFEVWIFFEFCWIIDIQIHKFLSKLTYVWKKVKITRKVMTSFMDGTYLRL